MTIRPVNIISEAVSIREDMKKMPEEYLWVHANEIEDIFPLQSIFRLHPSFFYYSYKSNLLHYLRNHFF